MPISEFPSGSSLGRYTVCTSSTRPASPSQGDTIYETDTGYLKQYQGATDTWTMPWGVSWGHIGEATFSSATTTTSSSFADVTGAAITWTAIANRRYRYIYEFHALSSVAADVMEWVNTDGSNTQQGTPGQAEVVLSNSNLLIPLRLIFEETGIAAGSVTRKLRHKRVAGSGTCQSYADGTITASVEVEDIGPNGAPS